MSSPQPFLIANYGTGLDEERQPWLLPRDAFTILENGRVFKGVLEPRKGLQDLGQTRCIGESSTVTNSATLPSVDVTTSLPATGPIYIQDASGVFTVAINGADDFSGDYDTGVTPTINRGTGQITFDWSSGSATNHPKLSIPEDCSDPIVGLFNYIFNDGSRSLIAITTKYINVYDDATGLFNPMVFSGNYPSATFTGNETNFFRATMYPDADQVPRLVVTNNVDVPAFVDLINSPLVALNYTSTTDNSDYQAPALGALSNALHLYYFNERLVFFNVTLGSTVFPTAYLFSAIKDSSGNGDKFNSPGAGLQIIPDETPITGSTQMGDRIITFTEQNAWDVTSTQDFDLPFRHRRVMDSDFQMSSAQYGSINWLQKAYGFGFWGIFRTDGRATDRIDLKIPFFTRKDIQANKIGIVNAGAVMESSQLLWTYPSIDQAEADNFADKILAFNFEEESFSKYDLALTTIGTYKQTETIPWDSVNENYLAGKPEWAQWDTTSDIWDSFFWQGGAFKSIGGDRYGRVFWLEETNDDICLDITGVSQASAAVITVASTSGIFVGDSIRIDGVVSASNDMEEIINGFTFIITALTSTTITINLNTSNVSAYSSGGFLCQLFDFTAQTKALNPFVEQNKQCRLHKIWFYIKTGTDNILLDFFSDRREDPYKENVVLDASDSQGETQKKWIPITVNQTAAFHTIRMRQEAILEPCAIEAMMLLCSPTGRIY